MKLDRTFYHSWCLVVLGSLWPLLILEVSAQTTSRQHVGINLDEGSGEIQDATGNLEDDQLLTSSEDASGSAHENSTQNNQIYDHTEIFIPKDHFIWSKHEMTYAFEGQALLGHIMVEFDNAYSVTQCSDRCMRHVPECKSYNYQEDTHICQLNAKSDLDAPENLQNATGTMYYRTTAFTARESILGGCEEVECLNGGRCLDLERLDADPPAICSCPIEYGSGRTCTGSPEITEWGAWGEWGSCTVTCGEGWRRRYRECRGDTDSGGDLYCLGEAMETEKCVLETCPYWDDWSVWSECSVSSTCGSGTQIKSRFCKHGGSPGVDRMCKGPLTANKSCIEPSCSEAVKLTDYSVYGGGSVEVYDNLKDRWVSVCASDWNKHDADVICRQLGFHDGAAHAITNGTLPAPLGPKLLSGMGCQGDEYNIQKCQHDVWDSGVICDENSAGVACIVDGMWGGWTEWGMCSVTCEDGVRTRTRLCDNPPPAYGGDPCPGDDTEYMDCTMIPCPVDGTWKTWAEWSSCNVTCGGGWSIRTRECNVPKHDGEPCPGPSEDRKTCNTHHCPVNGSWQPWQEWQSCNVSCGGGTQVRHRVCTQPLHGGETCPGPNDERRDCNTNPCPVDGSWKAWEEWAACSQTCGNGTRERTRSCNLGLHGGTNCTGPAKESEKCYIKSCAIDGVWEEWSEWSSCSVTCNNGTKTRNRTCTGPFYGGKPCPGPSGAVRECFPLSCPVDGRWEPWTDWGSCSVTCGNGTQERVRECVGTAHGGKPCEGAPVQNRTCFPKECPVDGTWSEWGAWGECDVECNEGHKYRNRTCDGIVGDGAPCPGNNTDREPCYVTCTVPGEWMEWSEWGLCSVTCGGGFRYKTRECNMTTWGEFTSMCEGINSTSLPCHNFSCTPLETTCQGWKARGLEDNTAVVIHPNPNEDSFWVHCDVDILNGTGVTMIYHSGMKRTLVKGYESSGEYEIELAYNATEINIEELKYVTGHCRQYLSWECQRASISNPFQPTTIMTYWIGNDNNKYHYFGGVTYNPDTYDAYAVCACSINNTCIDQSKRCNCDREDEDDQFLQDAGYLEYRDHLPIKTFFAGDTGQPGEEGFHKIGPLECWGDPVVKQDTYDNYDNGGGGGEYELFR